MTTRRVKRLDELAQSLPPPRDLWPAISAAIEADKLAAVTPVSAPRRYGWQRPAGAMAAAIALVTVGVFIGKAITPVAGPVLVTTSSVPAEYKQTSLGREANYRKERDALMVEAQNRLATMPTAEREKVAASLATLRRSITEIEAALGRDPANALLQELLVSSCQEEMRALTAVREAGGQET
jgi:hypothetical protein